MSRLDERVSAWQERLLASERLGAAAEWLTRKVYRPLVDPLLAIKSIDAVLRPEGHPALVGTFAGEHEVLAAVARLKAAGFTRLVVHSPAPSHALEVAVGHRASLVRYFTFVGGLLGAASGFALAAWSAAQWDLVTAGKPIISVPPYLIITFECTILGGAISTMIGFLISARLPQPRLAATYRERFGDDKFGVGVVCGADDAARAETVLREAGAMEVDHAAA